MHAKYSVAALLLLSATTALGAEPVGERPYEMTWANRTEDNHSALVDFENLEGWSVQCVDAEAQFVQSREQQLWGKHVGRLVYRGKGEHPSVTVKPPKPIPWPVGSDCVNFWICGNNWAWVPDPKTPQVEIAVLARNRDGKPVRVVMGRVNWQEWWVMHRRLTPEQQSLLGEGGVLEGFEVSGGRNSEDRTLFFDNLSVYRAALPALKFEPRPERNLTPFPGQTTGTNTGPGRLPFPTREETILPDNLTSPFEVKIESSGDSFAWHYRSTDGHLVYRYKPAGGTLGDLTAEWVGRGKAFQPMAEGGVFFARDAQGGHAPAEQMKLVNCRQSGDAVVSNWQAKCGAHTAEVTYAFRLWQKSLVIDIACKGGHAGEVRFGKAVGVQDPRLVTLPYLVCDARRPAVLVMGRPEEPLFLMGLVDYYRSNASALWAANDAGKDQATYNGGSRYQPKTDGRRNDCFERLFLTISPRFEEVLPNIPSPKSPWMNVAGERLWIAHGASDRQRDYDLWKKVARHGMTKVAITDHETGWRDGGESFTLRTRAAPKKGGDEGQADYARKVRALGFRYGIYNNYTDFAPVNEHWNEDYVTRLSDGQWHTAWARCYNLKPSRAVELETRLAPIIQQKFHLDTAYCDVHTAVAPWQYCDFDSRVPGAATFAATFYSYGEIMLHQKRTWDGPVYSEGNNHWYYCGLTDGNYGQDQAARLPENPWLVDFDLRKMHPLCCNFGMGNPGMFFGDHRGLGKTPEERESSLDRFLAATLAFGHTGFLVLDGGMTTAARSYFNVQQVHAAYAQETATDIRYADERGNLLPTSAAVANGAFRRSQIRTEYSNGLVVSVNGHPTEAWKTPEGELPPNGWSVKDPRGGKLIAWSKLVDGHRADYVDSPAYLYADGRGRLTRFERATCDGQLIVHRRPGHALELIPVGPCKVLGVSFGGHRAAATALDEEGKAIGPAETRVSRGIVYVMPVPKAFSYLLTPGPAIAVALKCDRRDVIPGETLTIEGQSKHTFQVPKDAAVGTQIWQQYEGNWIDFTVVPLAEARLELDASPAVAVRANVARPIGASYSLGGESGTLTLQPGEVHRLPVALTLGKGETRSIALKLTAGEMSFERTWSVKAEESFAELVKVPEQFHPGLCFRKGKEQSLREDTGALAHWSDQRCGGVARRSLFMHPPYMNGVGYSFALFGPIDLPADKAAFRCLIGKADGSDPGDGILFRVAVVEPNGTETVVAEKQWITHAWTPLEADLARWAGKRVRIKLIADVGPADDSSGDWACWAQPRIESAKPVLRLTILPK